MEISEAQEKRRELVNAIESLIEAFERETGAVVKTVSGDRHPVAGNVPGGMLIEIEVCI